MSQLSKSLERRIQELRELIDSHQTQLAAYEHVLRVETSKGSTAAEEDSEAASDAPAGARRGGKKALVMEIVQSFGHAGGTPKEIDAVFARRKVPRSKNLIYNTLNYLMSQKAIQRRDGKYSSLSVSGKAAAAKRTAGRKAAPVKKRQLSPEGRKRIQEALRKRWAAKKAAAAKKA